MIPALHWVSTAPDQRIRAGIELGLPEKEVAALFGVTGGTNNHQSHRAFEFQPVPADAAQGGACVGYECAAIAERRIKVVG
jgi:hypothetical protein